MTRITQCNFAASTDCGNLYTIAEAPTVSALAPRHSGEGRGRDAVLITLDVQLITSLVHLHVHGRRVTDPTRPVNARAYAR